MGEAVEGVVEIGGGEVMRYLRRHRVTLKGYQLQLQREVDRAHTWSDIIARGLSSVVQHADSVDNVEDIRIFTVRLQVAIDEATIAEKRLAESISKSRKKKAPKA